MKQSTAITVKRSVIPAILAVVLLFAVTTGCSSIPAAESYLSDDREQAWVNDIDYLKETLPKVHKDLFFQLPQAEFERRLEELKEKIPTCTDEQLQIALSVIVAAVGDTHTGSNLGSEYQYPLELSWFAEGVYIMGTDKTYQELVHSRIISLNGQAIEDVVQTLRPLLAGANESWLRTQIVYYLPMPAVLKYFGVADADEIELQVELPGGGTQSVRMAPMHYAVYEPADVPAVPVPLCRSNPDANYWYAYLPAEKTMYVCYQRCMPMEEPSFKDFNKQLWQEIGEYDVEKLVLDIRKNRGGRSPLLNPFIKAVAGSRWDQPDKFYVVTGKDTYSSAVLNAISLKNKTEAYFVGEATGGEPNHYGEVKQFRLPNSQITVRYSTKYFHWLDEDVNTLTPDTVVADTFAAYQAGSDPVMQWIAEQP